MTDINYSELKPREYLDSNDLIFINSINNRRFKNEILRFENKKYYYLAFMLENHMRLNNTFLNCPTAVFFVKHNNKISLPIQISYDDNYPFSAPAVTIGTKPYVDLFMSEYFFTENSKRVFGEDCKCCSHITCEHNWNPHFNIKKVLDEIYFNMKGMTRIYEMILCDIIIKKHFGFFLPIKRYL
tara:strand:- start:850 stop:1401 length:552 start_codon:yes stop_codon:yes gene_type:complete